jgi:hypothetical protein
MLEGLLCGSSGKGGFRCCEHSTTFRFRISLLIFDVNTLLLKGNHAHNIRPRQRQKQRLHAQFMAFTRSIGGRSRTFHWGSLAVSCLSLIKAVSTMIVVAISQHCTAISFPANNAEVMYFDLYVNLINRASNCSRINAKVGLVNNHLINIWLVMRWW